MVGRVVGLIVVLVSVFEALALAAGSRSILRVIESGVAGDAAVDLNATNFDSVLKETPASFAIVEFFAHWCPACRNYKPHFEKVARVFNGPAAAHPGMVLMARVDCALKINSKLCDNFSVTHYPMLLWGPPSKFGSGWKPKQDKSDLILIEDGRTADRLLGWINKQLGSSYGLDDEKFENDHLMSNASDPEQITKAIYDIEEATYTAFDIITEHKMIKPETRGSMITFLQLLVAHHPSRRCRKGSAEILVNFDDIYPSTSLVNLDSQPLDKEMLGNLRICGKDVPIGYWMFCRGSRNDTRGFSCGLWVLLHSLSVRVEDAESQFAFKATCEFIHNFFICEECRQHFYEMCSSVSNPFTKSRDFALWLWEAHNKVNERLMKEEASLDTTDPKFPKIVWPPKQLCSSCSSIHSQKNSATKRIEWNKDEVFKFLSDYYGKKLVSLYKDKDSFQGNKTGAHAAEEAPVATSAISVPVGAALAIAVTCCAFGALAWLWRSQQKNRKPRRIYN
uniref:Sulfhydryl oxidase n=1 Tax=Kalanchoe fedtschenkoi TaxID=63787 RepID=A0A7N0UBD8_KALFE